MATTTSTLSAGFRRLLPTSMASLALAGVAFLLPEASSIASDPIAAARARMEASPAPTPTAAPTSGSSPTAGPLSDIPAESTGQKGCIALFDGRVLSGTILPAPGGYLIHREGQSDEMIPTFLIHTTADSLHGCYINLRESVRQPRPDDHLRLAQWCLSQQLLDEARTELASALKLDPNRRDARDLLLRLEAATNPQPLHLQHADAPARTADGYLDARNREPGEIGPEATSLYVRRVQPILVSKCAMAGCHGGVDAQEFRIAHVRRSAVSGRAVTLENLRTVLAFVDSRDAESTRLFHSLTTPTHENVFSGPAGETQEQALREWVELAAADLGLKGAGGGPLADSSVWTREAIALASGQAPAPSRPRPKTARPPAAHSPLQRVGASPVLRPTPDGATTPAADQRAIVEKVLLEERPDPFDPAEFNRAVHRP